jgi:hypothetical protein
MGNRKFLLHHPLDCCSHCGDNIREIRMTGEPVNISNEKKVREENVSDKFKNVDYDKYGNK